MAAVEWSGFKSQPISGTVLCLAHVTCGTGKSDPTTAIGLIHSDVSFLKNGSISAAEWPSGPSGSVRLGACLPLHQGAGSCRCGGGSGSGCSTIAGSGRRAPQRWHPLVLGLGCWHSPRRDCQHRDDGGLRHRRLRALGGWRVDQEGMRLSCRTRPVAATFSDISASAAEKVASPLCLSHSYRLMRPDLPQGAATTRRTTRAGHIGC